MKRVAESFGALKKELDERMKGLPGAVNNGERLVPVSYDLTVEPLVSDEEHHKRELNARAWYRNRNYDRSYAGAVMRMYTHAQQSDDGIGVAMMTQSERAAASMEWSRQLRERVETTTKAHEERERNRVVVDLDWE